MNVERQSDFIDGRTIESSGKLRRHLADTGTDNPTDKGRRVRPLMPRNKVATLTSPNGDLQPRRRAAATTPDMDDFDDETPGLEVRRSTDGKNGENRNPDEDECGYEYVKIRPHRRDKRKTKTAVILGSNTTVNSSPAAAVVDDAFDVPSSTDDDGDGDGNVFRSKDRNVARCRYETSLPSLSNGLKFKSPSSPCQHFPCRPSPRGRLPLGFGFPMSGSRSVTPLTLAAVVDTDRSVSACKSILRFRLITEIFSIARFSR